jgi:hypothetical protein
MMGFGLKKVTMLAGVLGRNLYIGLRLPYSASFPAVLKPWVVRRGATFNSTTKITSKRNIKRDIKMQRNSQNKENYENSIPHAWAFHARSRPSSAPTERRCNERADGCPKKENKVGAHAPHVAHAARDSLVAHAVDAAHAVALAVVVGVVVVVGRRVVIVLLAVAGAVVVRLLGAR